jgi:hypothetical protein
MNHSYKKDEPDVVEYFWHMFDKSIIVGCSHPISLKSITRCEDKWTPYTVVTVVTVSVAMSRTECFSPDVGSA